jgi:hypothetical protein
MKDSTARALRTFAQTAVSFAAAGALTEIWNIVVSSYEIDPGVRGMIAVVLAFFVSKAQNEAENKGMVIPKITPMKTEAQG